MASNIEIDPALCEQYAQFASHLERWQFKILYWTLFFTNLAVLFFASWVYTKGQRALERYSPRTDKRASVLKTYILVCLGCVLLSTLIVVMQAYALLALQFCDGEHLMSLYWSTWTMTQVGSLIAMVGIILALLHSLRDRKHPPWALALGTPVLVIAGFLHLFHDCTKRRVKKMRQRRLSRSVESGGPPMSQANTIRESPDDEADGDDELRVEFIGFTVKGGPIVRFTNPQARLLASRGEILGYADGDRPIMAYEKGAVAFLSDTEAASMTSDSQAAKERRAAGSV